LPAPTRLAWPLNAGVVGLEMPRDEAIIDRWIEAAELAAGDRTLRPLFRLNDQGGLIWSLESLGLNPLCAPRSYHEQCEASGPKPPAGFAAALNEVRAAREAPLILHFAGVDQKPYAAWPAAELLDLSLAGGRPAPGRERLTIHVLGHDRAKLAACPDEPPLTHVYLPDLDPSNDNAESRIFHSDVLDHCPSEYIGLVTASWDKKYATHCWPLAELHRLPLLPRVVWCAYEIDGRWPELSDESHPGFLPVLEQVASWAGLAPDDYHRPAFWSNNFIAHRSIVRELAAFHRRLWPRILSTFGRLPPYDTSGQDGDARKLSYLTERVTMLFFANRPDLEIVRIPGAGQGLGDWLKLGQ
ncbi:MAG TPA: hypothetical protein VIK18_14205, partial [Pirellulales bacterium]